MNRGYNETSAATLYHTPMACSTAVRIAAAMGDLPLNIVRVNLTTHTLSDGSDYRAVNPLGQVSTLHLPDGTLLSETLACLVWINSCSTDARFHRAANAPDYHQLIRWLSFVATELHKQIFRIVFYDEATPAVKDKIRALAPARFAMLEAHLENQPWLLGSDFSAADAYLVWALMLSEKAGLDISAFAGLCAYLHRARNQPEIAQIIADDQANRKTKSPT